MPAPRRRYRFRIHESFSPETLPMHRLAEYMVDLASLLGEKAAVHFVAVEDGSAVLVQDIEHEAYPKVRDRVRAVKHGEGPTEAQRAYVSLNRRLADDNASGDLIEDPTPEVPQHPPGTVLDFPGCRRFVELPYGPFNQAGALQGVVIVIGGESDPVPVHLEDGDQVHVCRAKRSLAKELARHLFATPIRVTGTGRWLRDGEGRWIMKSFTIADYCELRGDSLAEATAKLRSIPAAWKRKHENAVGLLHSLRHGETS